MRTYCSPYVRRLVVAAGACELVPQVVERIDLGGVERDGPLPFFNRIRGLALLEQRDAERRVRLGQRGIDGNRLARVDFGLLQVFGLACGPGARFVKMHGRDVLHREAVGRVERQDAPERADRIRVAARGAVRHAE